MSQKEQLKQLHVPLGLQTLFTVEQIKNRNLFRKKQNGSKVQSESTLHVPLKNTRPSHGTVADLFKEGEKGLV